MIRGGGRRAGRRLKGAPTSRLLKQWSLILYGLVVCPEGEGRSPPVYPLCTHRYGKEYGKSPTDLIQKKEPCGTVALQCSITLLAQTRKLIWNCFSVKRVPPRGAGCCTGYKEPRGSLRANAATSNLARGGAPRLIRISAGLPGQSAPGQPTKQARRDRSGGGTETPSARRRWHPSAAGCLCRPPK